MYLQEILEVAIGLIFMWLVISIAAMQIQEWIANLLDWRAKYLEKAVQAMLTNENLAEELYNHPLISNLAKKYRKPGKRILPSYIPAQQFAVALFDLLIKAGTRSSPINRIFEDIRSQVDELDNPDHRKLAKQDWEALLSLAIRVATSQAGEEAIDSLKAQIYAYCEKYPELKETIETAMPELEGFFQRLLLEMPPAAPGAQDKTTTLRQIRLGLIAIEAIYPDLKVTLEALLSGVEEYVARGEQTLALARSNIEDWFNATMDRLSGWYKRRAQLISFIIGLIIAILLNVDSVALATTLWREPTLRQAIVAQVEAYAGQDSQPLKETTAAQPRQSIDDLKSELEILKIPFGWTFEDFDTGDKTCAVMPITGSMVFGFPGVDQDGLAVCNRVANLPKDIGGWVSKVAGILMTAAAAAQGAPFWFDILKKLVNVRGSGPNPTEVKK